MTRVTNDDMVKKLCAAYICYGKGNYSPIFTFTNLKVIKEELLF